MKNYGDLGGCYPPWATASTDNPLLDLHNSSYDTKAEFNNDNSRLEISGVDCTLVWPGHMSVGQLKTFENRS